MVLKFCGGLWPGSLTDDDLDAAASRERRLQELLTQDAWARRRASKPLPPKFAKEVRVVFDSTRPHGLVLKPVGGGGDDDGGAHGYVCAVAQIDTASDSEAAAYNARCKAVGDYAHVIVEAMRVRCLDNTDLDGVAFDDVVKRISKRCASGGGCAITFADVSSPRPQSPMPKLKAVGKMVLAAQRVKKSPQTQPQRSQPRVVVASASSPASPTSLSARRSVFNANASPKVSKWSSVLTAVAETAKANQSDVLASDLAHKNAHLEAQLLLLKGKVATLERARDALASEQDKSNSEMLELLTSLQQQTLDARAKDVVTSEERGAIERRSLELEAENESLRADVAALQAAMEKHQHDADTVLLQLQELQVEHRDVQHHAEELHARLVAAQLAKCELHEKLALALHEHNKEDAAWRLLQAELAQNDGAMSGQQRRRRSSVSSMGVVSDQDSPAVALLKRVVQARDALQTQNDELQIELSCHDTTIQHQQERLVELEDKLAAVEQMRDSLREQVRAYVLQGPDTAVAVPSECREPSSPAVLQTPTGESDRADLVTDLQRQLAAEQLVKERMQDALQALADKARAKLETHEKEQTFLAQFKEQLVRGVAVTKYGSRGKPHARVLFADAQCRWLSWRDPGDPGGSASPRADAKVETLDLVEVLLGAATETFSLHRPDVPARCLSLVCCRPCRTLDVELETRDRALQLRRGFRLLIEEAAEKRRRDEEGQRQ